MGNGCFVRSTCDCVCEQYWNYLMRALGCNLDGKIILENANKSIYCTCAGFNHLRIVRLEAP